MNKSLLKQTQSLDKTKKEQKAIVHSVAIEKQQLGELKEEVKTTQETIQGLDKTLKIKQDEVKNTDKRIVKSEEKITELQEMVSEKSTEQARITNEMKDMAKMQVKEANAQTAQLQKNVLKKTSELRDADNNLKALQKATEKTQAERDALQSECDRISAILVERRNRLDGVYARLAEAEKALKDIEFEIGQKNIDASGLKEMEQSLIVTKNEREGVQNEIKTARRELMGISEIKRKRLEEVVKHEEDLEKREATVRQQELQLTNRTDKVERLAQTIQKHSDRYKMGIKIWPEQAQATS